MALTNRNKNAIRDRLLDQMGITGYETFLRNQGQPPKGDGPKIYKLASELYGPPLSRVALSEGEQDKRFRALQKLGVRPELLPPMLSSILAARLNNKKSGRVKSPVNVLVSDLRVTLFNITIEGNEEEIDLMNIVNNIKLPFVKKRYSNGYSVEVVEVKARHGKFQTAFSITDEYTFKSRANVNPASINALEFKIRLIKGQRVQGASFTLYSSGAVRFSGGYLDVSLTKTNRSNAALRPIIEQPDTIRKHIVNTYTDKEDSLFGDLVFNNIGAIFMVDHPILLDKTAELEAFIRTASYEPDMSPRLIIRMGGDPVKFTLQLSTAGVIQLKGINKPDDLPLAFAKSLEMVKEFEYKPFPIPDFDKRKFKVSPISKRADKLPSPDVTRRGTTCPVKNRPNPYSFQGACADVQKKMRSGGYRIANCYVKPNPQGQPCCRAVPLSTKYSKNNVANTYIKANVKSPENVRNTFDAGKNTNNKKNNVGQENFTAENTFLKNAPAGIGLKIGTRQCMRYTRVALYDMAMRLGIMDVSSKTPKEKLCEKIRLKGQEIGANKTRETFGNLSVQFTVDGKRYSVYQEGKKFRIGNRVCSTYSKPELVGFATALRIPDADMSLKKTKLCELIKTHADQKRGVKQREANADNAEAKSAKRRRIQGTVNRVKRVANKKVANAKQLKKEKAEAFDERIGFTEPVILAELPKLFGPKFMRAYGNKIRPDFPEMAKLMLKLLGIRKFNTGKRGDPTKPSVDKAKRDIIKEWKRVIEPSIIRSSVFASMNNVRASLRNLVGPGVNITDEMLVSYAKSVRSAAGTRDNKTGKFGTATQIKKAKNVWLYAERTYGNLKVKTPPTRTPVGRSVNREEI